MHPVRSYNELGDGHKSRRSMLLATCAATSNEDQPQLLRVLLENGASVFEWDVEGNTGIHLAIIMALPDQPWVVKTLTTLIQAGADPTQPNHAGYTAYDLACNTAPEFGSFRRDLLLQALIESESDIQDDRLLAPPDFTAFYTSIHRETICGNSSTDMMSQLRKALLDRLTCTANHRNITPSRRLHEAAVDRVLTSCNPRALIEPNAILDEALDYLERMGEAKKQIVRMTKERLPQQS